ncbi:MAG: hypothetical protein DLM55_01625 [Acidimicrobiales bacterium]|nr:MAG: hypothetical protein DLM55_01625 [Acidimicrobiales bacterium]
MSPAAYSTDGRSVTEAAQAPREYSSSRDTYASGAGSRGGYDPNATGTAQTENCVQPGVSSLPVRNVADAQPDSLAPAARAPQGSGGRGGRGSHGSGGRGSRGGPGSRGGQGDAPDSQGVAAGPPAAGQPVAGAPALPATRTGGARGSNHPDDCTKAGASTSGSPLRITQSGTYDGTGKPPVGAIDIEADNVVLQGYTVCNPNDTGITIGEKRGANNVTVRNNTVSHPMGHDGDTLRFFGNNITIQHNTFGNTDNVGGKRHADCMQTFVTSTVPSQNVTIDSNVCANIANICLMAEGAGSKSGGQGKGPSSNWRFTNNTCQFGASQGLQLESVSNVTVTGNTFSGHSNKAVSCVRSSGITASGNTGNPTAAQGCGGDSRA